MGAYEITTSFLSESSAFGDDMSLNDSEHRLRCTTRSTPSSGYQRQRHYTDGHPATAHCLDLADRQRTSSTSQLQPATILPASNVIQIQPASMSLADMQERTCEMTSPRVRSREHLRLPLPGAVQLHHTSKELGTVVTCEVMSPHRRLSDPSTLSGSPREVCSLGERGEEFSHQNTVGQNQFFCID